MKKLVIDWMNKSFQVLSYRLKPIEAIDLLGDKIYGILEDTHSRPIAFITADNLRQASLQGADSLFALQEILHPIIVIEQATEMQSVLDSPYFETIVQKSKAALVVDDVEKVVGILSVERIRDYMVCRPSALRGPTMGGTEPGPNVSSAGLGGIRIQKSYPRACFERGCGYINQFTDDEWKNLHRRLATGDKNALPNCQNSGPGIVPHRFQLP